MSLVKQSIDFTSRVVLSRAPLNQVAQKVTMV
jgi:hypothetical protein